MKWVISSDWHLDAVTAGVERFGDVDQAVRETVSTALERGASKYLMLGDLCDPGTMRTTRASAYAIAIDRFMREQGIEPWWLVGNHDVIEDGTGLSTLSPLKAAGGNVIDEPGAYYVDDGGDSCVLVALPYTPRSHTYDPEEAVRNIAAKSAGDPGCNAIAALKRGAPTLVIGHLNLRGIVPGSETADLPRGRDVFWPTDAVRECFPTAVMIGGHYHERQVYDGVNIVGSLERLTFGEESNEPGYMVVEV